MHDPDDSIEPPPITDEDLAGLRPTGARRASDVAVCGPLPGDPGEDEVPAQSDMERPPGPTIPVEVNTVECSKPRGGSYNPPSKSQIEQKCAPNHEENTPRVEISSAAVTRPRAPEDVAGSRTQDGQTPIAQLSPVTVDGHTRFRLSDWSMEMAPMRTRRLLSALKTPISQEQERSYRRAGGRHVWIPLTAPTPTDPDGKSRAYATFTVSGSRSQTMTFHVEGHVFIVLHIESGAIEVQLKTRAMWAMGGSFVGYGVMARYWLREVTEWLMGKHARENLEIADGDLFKVHPKSDDHCTIARVIGWKTMGIELCSDFTGLVWMPEDAANFVGSGKTQTYNGIPEDGEIGSDAIGRRGRTETINIGNRQSPKMACLYNKSVQIERAKDGDGSSYHPTWRAAGWNGEDEVQRVEIRLQKEALVMHRRDTGKTLDLTDPGAIAKKEVMETAWAWATFRMRLTVRDNERATRRSVDPRWAEVQRATVAETLNGVEKWIQHREVQDECNATANERARRALILAALRMAAGHGQSLDEATIKRALGKGMTEPDMVAQAKVRQHVYGSVVQSVTLALDGVDHIELAQYQYNHRARWDALMGQEAREKAKLWVSRLQVVTESARQTLDRDARIVREADAANKDEAENVPAAE